MKRSYSAKKLIVSSLITFVIGAAISYGLMYQRVRQAEDVGKAMQKIETVYKTIYANYYKKITTTQLEDGAINGMIGTLGDQFSDYMSKKEAQDLNNTISGSFSGIGAEVKKDGDYAQIVSPIPKTPAQKAGLKAHDLILEVDGKSVKNKTLNEVIGLIRGKKGTSVTLKLKREDNEFVKKIVRDDIPVTTVTGHIAKNDSKIGYIQISSFSTNTSKEFKNEVVKLRKKGAKSFIIDVRNNPGGLMDQALKMSSMFLKDNQTIMQVQNRDGKKEVYKSGKEYDSGFKVSEPTVVLVNGGSASAAEIFAAALNQSHIKLIGTKTYGKGTVQTPQEYDDGTELKITVAKWLTPNGTWIHKKGIKPTIEVDYPKVAYLTDFDAKKTYVQGDSSKSVKDIQLMLKYLEYFKGDIGDQFTEDTKNAVKEFQKSNGIEESGKIDQKTGEKLEQKVAEKLSKNDPIYDRGIEELKKAE